MLINKYFSIKVIVIVLIVLGCWQFSSGSYIYIKAQLAQLLLNSAWSKTVESNQKVKPWGWADTYPVSKITFGKAQEKYIVLAGGSGRTMAFGPGHVNATPLPGDGGNSVLVGHRDTHFSVLETLNKGDVILVETPHKNLKYRVSETFVIHEDQTKIMQNDGNDRLTLITCYPFDALSTGGPLRYVVIATPFHA